MKKIPFFAALLFLALQISSASASSVTWGAQSNSPSVVLKLSDGLTLDPTGNLVRLGFFNFPTATTPAQRDLLIQANAPNPSTLNGFFTEYSSTFVGRFNGSPQPAAGRWADTPSNANAIFYGQQIFYWTFNSPTLAGATQSGIFYTDKATLPAWTFPTDVPIPAITMTDLNQVTNVVYGSGTVASGSFNMAAVVPEPSSILLSAVGAFAALLFSFLRRLRRRA